MEPLTIIWGTSLILAAIVVPGLAVTAALMPKPEDIRWSERIGLSFVFGLTPYLLLHFLTKNVNFPITTSTTLLTLGAVTVASAAVWNVRRNRN